MWEQFREGMNRFFNHPAVITVIAFLCAAFVGLVILSRTSFGQKLLKKLEGKVENALVVAQATKKVVDEAKEEIKEAKDVLASECKACTVELEEKVTAVYSRFEIFQNDVFAVLDEIPNAKVHDKIQELKKNALTKEKEIQDLLGGTYVSIEKAINDEVVERVKTIKEQSENEIATLKNEIAELKELFKISANVPETGDLTPKKGNDNDGEREETTNEQTED